MRPDMQPELLGPEGIDQLLEFIRPIARLEGDWRMFPRLVSVLVGVLIPDAEAAVVEVAYEVVGAICSAPPDELLVGQLSALFKNEFFRLLVKLVLEAPISLFDLQGHMLQNRLPARTEHLEVRFGVQGATHNPDLGRALPERTEAEVGEVLQLKLLDPVRVPPPRQRLIALAARTQQQPRSDLGLGRGHAAAVEGGGQERQRIVRGPQGRG
mmetsp:Transcript_84521/g.273235  ORF Transcript_84521/g.273235 Transcript_84521/m.273235 type:complete len:212 (-) Transcript_84521:762-1397(-)